MRGFPLLTVCNSTLHQQLDPISGFVCFFLDSLQFGVEFCLGPRAASCPIIGANRSTSANKLSRNDSTRNCLWDRIGCPNHLQGERLCSSFHFFSVHYPQPILRSLICNLQFFGCPEGLPDTPRRDKLPLGLSQFRPRAFNASGCEIEDPAAVWRDPCALGVQRDFPTYNVGINFPSTSPNFAHERLIQVAAKLRILDESRRRPPLYGRTGPQLPI